MAQYSKKERLIASALSSVPGLKRILKKFYVSLNYYLYRSRQDYYILSDRARGLYTISSQTQQGETFFGYYDKSPENSKGLILFYETAGCTFRKPSSSMPLRVIIATRENKDWRKLSETTSYNWQQGARAQWINDNSFIMNFYDRNSGQYKSRVIDAFTGITKNEYCKPVQDVSSNGWFLSINYSRIMRLRPDYGYRNKPLPSNKEMEELNDDGIWKIDLDNGKSTLIHSLADIASISPKPTASGAMHKVNHILISPDGNRFVFIHRWYNHGRRYDRLLLSDLEKLTVLCDDDMVSHLCWVDNSTLFGYLRHNGKNGFYFIDLKSKSLLSCDVLNKLELGDGHPSAHGDKIVFDSYPDKGGMQHLYLLNIRKGVVEELLRVRHSPKYFGECRCDMHPRFSPNGDRIYFDTVLSGKRKLSYIDLKID